MSSLTIPYNSGTANQYSISGSGIIPVVNSRLSLGNSSIRVTLDSLVNTGTIYFTLTTKDSTTACAASVINDSVIIIPAIADTVLWTGATDTSWNNTANWSSNILPSSTTNVVIPGGLTNYPNLNSGTAAVNSFTIQSGATVIISNSATLKIYGSVNISSTGLVRVIGIGSGVDLIKNQ